MSTTTLTTTLSNTFGKLFGSGRRPGDRPNSQLLYLGHYIAGCDMSQPEYLGRRSVPLSRIKGSASPGRIRDFDGDFRLRNKTSRQRLNGVARAWRRQSLPPVSLVEVDDVYFVQDGHHRVAISRANQQERITANVTTLKRTEPSSADA